MQTVYGLSKDTTIDTIYMHTNRFISKRQSL